MIKIGDRFVAPFDYTDDVTVIDVEGDNAKIEHDRRTYEPYWVRMKALKKPIATRE